ncbi:hypothetical protein MMC25_004797 [Agyrium rufum]|nr:hypothetical protein [Agyrium rufum]
MSLHERAQQGFSSASSYDTHRPSYPPKIVSALLEHLDLANALNARILDVGAGTGKFTALLAAREEDFEIVAVEPHAQMRAELEKKALQRVEVIDSNVMNLVQLWEDEKREKVDGVVAAQKTVSDIRSYLSLESRHIVHSQEILAEQSCKCLEDNAPADWTPTTKWETKMKAVIWEQQDEKARFRHSEWQKVFDERLKTTPWTIPAADPLFSLPLGHESEEFVYWLTKDAIWDRFHTLSMIAVMEGEQLEATKLRVYEAMNDEDAVANEKGELPLHGKTVIYWTSAIPGAPLVNGG